MKKRESIEDRGNRKTTVGGNWTVRFNTTGKANLTITAVNGTTWTNQPYERYDEETEILTRGKILLRVL